MRAITALGVVVLLAGCATPAAVTPSESSGAPAALPAPPRLLYEWYTGAVGDSDKALFIADAQGSGSARLASDAVPESSVVHGDWSPDGQQIAFTAQNGDAGSVWIADSDGMNAVEAIACEADPCLQVDYPIWSPDGKSILVVQLDKIGDIYGASHLVVVDVESSSRRVIAETADGTTSFSYPSWSPDGTRVTAALELYADPASDNPTGSAIVVVDAAQDIARPQMISDPALFGVNPDWSPDGGMIVFSTYQLGPDLFVDQPSNLYLIAPDGSGLTQLTHTTLSDNQRIGQPTWTPDGKQIVATIGVLDDNHQMQTVQLAYVDPTTGVISDLGVSGSNGQLQPIT